MSHRIAMPPTTASRRAPAAGSVSRRKPPLQSDTPATTGWLPGNRMPAHEGVYERRAPAGAYACFSGDRWFGDASTPAEAAAARIESPHQTVDWRGLTTPPAEPCGTCRGHTLVDRGIDADSGADLIDECPDC